MWVEHSQLVNHKQLPEKGNYILGLKVKAEYKQNNFHLETLFKDCEYNKLHHDLTNQKNYRIPLITLICSMFKITPCIFANQLTQIKCYIQIVVLLVHQISLGWSARYVGLRIASDAWITQIIGVLSWESCLKGVLHASTYAELSNQTLANCEYKNNRWYLQKNLLQQQRLRTQHTSSTCRNSSDYAHNVHNPVGITVPKGIGESVFDRNIGKVIK